jgi:hypothetical protein
MHAQEIPGQRMPRRAGRTVGLLGTPSKTPYQRDQVHGVISVVYHALRGAETCAEYVRDAEAAGEEELVRFFEEVQDEHLTLANRAKRLLGAYLHESDDELLEDDDDPRDPVDASTAAVPARRDERHRG